MKTTQNILLVMLLSMIAFFAHGQTNTQAIVKLPKRLANKSSCTVTLINLDSREKFTYVTNFDEYPAIDLASYPSGQVYYYAITIKSEIVDKGNFFYPYQLNKRTPIARTVSIESR